MKALFKNTTKYTKENCDNFLEFHANKYGTKELIEFVAIIISCIYIVISNLIYKNWKSLIIIVVFVFVIYLLAKYKIEKKSREKRTVREFTFYFYDKYLKVRHKKKSQRYQYFQLHRIFETEEYFFLYLDEKQSLILSKSGFEIGTVEDFREFIRKKCPLKYKNEIKSEKKAIE